jgi:PST family polysaccharide transporter
MNPKESLTSKVVKSGAWIYGRFLATSIINIFVMAILARRLTPSEFGIVALASVILKFLVVIGSEGVNEFVIYDNKEGKELRTKAAFWMNFTFCFAAAIVGWILVPFISKFYDESILKAILNTLLLKYLLDNLSKVPDAILQKKFDFDKLVIRDTVLEIASSIISVILAFAGFGVWSLVLPGLIVAPIRTIIVFDLAKWLPGFKMYLKEWPQIFRYSSLLWRDDHKLLN